MGDAVKSSEQSFLSSARWNPVSPFPDGEREVLILFSGGDVLRIKLMKYGQWSDSHFGDIVSAYPPGTIRGWCYATDAAPPDHDKRCDYWDGFRCNCKRTADAANEVKRD